VNLQFNFVADCIVRNKAYPALAQQHAEPYTPEWRQFGDHWPYTVPCNLIDHCNEHNFPYMLYTIDSFPPKSFYPIALQFFDFCIDYFSLINASILDQIRLNRIIILFYYDEGDNPFLIKKQLDQLCKKHSLPYSCYRFISANTSASFIKGFINFVADELLYWQRNKSMSPIHIHNDKRSKEFTVLSRTHKWWRATVMTDLVRNNLLHNSYWSYNTNIVLNESPKDNPIEVDTLNIRSDIDEFLKSAPYTCDSQTSEQHNDHSQIESVHYSNSYCNIVLETHYDADQSGGAFLTEKTFKPIKHGQPFVIVGAPGSLAALRKLGYRTFDHIMDNSYDTIQNNTQRWQKTLQTIQQIQQQDMHEWFQQCVDDVAHNQQLFLSSKYTRLNSLYERLHD
jgi:hypothetical protein